MLNTLICTLIVIFGASFAAPWICRYLKNGAVWLLSAAPFTAFFLLLSQSGSVAEGSAIVYHVEWFSSLGCAFSLRLDGLALLMGLLVTGIGGLIVIYAAGYMRGHARLGRFYLYLLSFMGAMLGLVLSDNLIVMFVFWELTGVTSYLLIGFNHEEQASRWKALQALLVTGLGAMAMLAGFILIAQTTGTYALSEINGMGELLQSSPFYTAMVLLVLGGAFTKSAQIPFHFWLPNAMAAPTPVSAYLHSATMVKAGIFLLARLNPSLGDTALWGNTLSIFGSLTLLLAVFLGLFQKDLKAILAYTTLGVLGMLTMLLGIGTDYAIQAMVGFLCGHALYKAALFMVAGCVDHECGTRNVTLLRGLRRVMPITAVAGALAALSMSGLPPFFGFLGKELVYKSGVQLEGPALYFLAVAFIGNFLMMALALKAGIGPFFGKPAFEALPKKPHEAPFCMWIGPVVLGLGGLVLGLFPYLVTGLVIAPAVGSIQGGAIPSIELKLWHGFNLPLLLSVLTVVSGIALFMMRGTFWLVADRVRAALRPYGAEAAYEHIFKGIIWFSKAQTRWLQTGRLHDYVFMIVLTTVGLLIWAIVNYGGFKFEVDWSEFDLIIMGLVVLMVIATLVAVTATAYMTVLIALGVVGFGVALIFVYYGAPDLAITQLLVEVLTVVLFMFVVMRLPPLQNLSSKMMRLFDAILASTFGGLIMLLVLKAVNIQFNYSISDKLAAMSYPVAKGKNVVNVILVDFRALDTLGEITVIAAAALGIAALVSIGFKVKGRSL
jgi:multicomponent Na+:H+ antiporter subunit A